MRGPRVRISDANEAAKPLAEPQAIGVYPLCIYSRRGELLRARIAKWGNSLGVRIPRAMAREVGLDEGSDVEVKVSDGDVVLTPTSREYSLKELVAGITPRNRHGQTDWGPPVGNEHW